MMGKSYLSLCACIVLLFIVYGNATKYCHEILADKTLKKISWPYLKQCLKVVSGEDYSKEVGANIWRLVKVAFDSLDNIPAESYRSMGYSLTFIPDDELRNISLENVDVVESFGAIRCSSKSKPPDDGFKPQQLTILAQKVRHEWLGKNPRTYSEYDLMAMGEILCYLNVTDIEQVHPDAFKEAAEWIGMIEKCPQDRLQALANLAKRPEAFGEPQRWSKLEVSIVGNVINGLNSLEIHSISKDKLQLNNYYKMSKGKRPALNKSNNNVEANMPANSPTQHLEKNKTIIQK